MLVLGHLNLYLLKDPVLHFLAVGLYLFVVFDAVSPESGEADPKTIVVDRDTLLTYIQYRTKVFEPKLAAARLDNMNDATRQRFIDDYVKEEVLFREAKALGLEKALRRANPIRWGSLRSGGDLHSVRGWVVRIG